MVLVITAQGMYVANLNILCGHGLKMDTLFIRIGMHLEIYLMGEVFFFFFELVGKWNQRFILWKLVVLRTIYHRVCPCQFAWHNSLELLVMCGIFYIWKRLFLFYWQTWFEWIPSYAWEYAFNEMMDLFSSNKFKGESKGMSISRPLLLKLVYK